MRCAQCDKPDAPLHVTVGVSPDRAEYEGASFCSGTCIAVFVVEHPGKLEELHKIGPF